MGLKDSCAEKKEFRIVHLRRKPASKTSARHPESQDIMGFRV